MNAGVVCRSNFSFKYDMHITEDSEEVDNMTTRDTRIAVSTDELDELKSVKEELYGENAADGVPHAAAILDLIEHYRD